MASAGVALSHFLVTSFAQIDQPLQTPSTIAIPIALPFTVTTMLRSFINLFRIKSELVLVAIFALAGFSSFSKIHSPPEFFLLASS